MGNLMKRLFWVAEPLPTIPLKMPAEATLPAVRTVVMPNGKKVRVMRDDVFQKAIRPKTDRAA